MANRKLSEHTAITGANVNPNADYIEILDVSDTTDAASGTNKKILPSQLLIAIGAEPAKGADDNYVTDAEKVVIGNTSGTNTGDNAVNSTYASAKTKTDFITITQNVDLDTIETNSNASKVKTDLITVTQPVDLDAIETRVNDLDASVILKGGWDASAGTFPASGTAQAGWSYIVTVAGTVDGISFALNDRIVAVLDNASTSTYASNWLKLDYTDQVLSVSGRTGAVMLAKSDVGLSNVDNTSDANKPVSSAQQTAINAKQNTLGNGDVTLAMINATGTPGAGNYLRGDGTWSAVPGGGSSIEILTATIGTTQNDYAISGISNDKNVLSVLRITPSASFKITGISATGLDDGKRVRIYNNSDPLTAGSMIILAERNSTSSLSANRLLSPIYGSFPPIITPGQYLDFELNTTVGSWTLVSASDWGNPNGFFDTYSDCHVNAPFLTNTATAGSIGATSSSSLAATTQKTIGTMLHTITTNGGRAYLGTQSGAMYLGSGSALGMARVAFLALADATDDYFSCNLFTDAAGGASPVDQVGWLYNRSSSTDWRTSTVESTSETTNTITGFTPSTTVAHTIGCFINGDGTRADFFYSVDGETWTFAASHTTDVPNGTSRSLGFMTGFTKTAGNGSKTMITDWLGFKLMTKRGV